MSMGLSKQEICSKCWVVLYTQLLTDTFVLTIYVQKKPLSEINLGLSLKTKHGGMDYDNLFGIGIPDIFMNMLSCKGFINNNKSIVILKCTNRMSQYYFNKGFIQLKCDKDHLKNPWKMSKKKLVQSWK